MLATVKFDLLDMATLLLWSPHLSAFRSKEQEHGRTILSEDIVDARILAWRWPGLARAGGSVARRERSPDSRIGPHMERRSQLLLAPQMMVDTAKLACAHPDIL